MKLSLLSLKKKLNENKLVSFICRTSSRYRVYSKSIYKMNIEWWTFLPVQDANSVIVALHTLFIIVTQTVQKTKRQNIVLKQIAASDLTSN